MQKGISVKEHKQKLEFNGNIKTGRVLEGSPGWDPPYPSNHTHRYSSLMLIGTKIFHVETLDIARERS